MLQYGIHCVITDLIVSLCKDISSQRKKTWPEGVGPICDWEEWVAKGRPNPTGTISTSLQPEYNPIAILRVLNEFFQDDKMQDRLRMSTTRRTRVITADYAPELHSVDLHTTTSMELFNGVGSSLHGGTRNRIGPAIPYVNSWDDGTDWDNSPAEYINNYYKAWGCENDFVHPKNVTIGSYSQEYLDRVSNSLTSLGSRENPHGIGEMYPDINFINDNNPSMLDRDGTIQNVTQNEKRKIVYMFLTQLCKKYTVDEPGVSPFDRATWYEVSEFIKFYCDIWQRIDHPDGDEEEWIMEGITTEPLSSYRYISTMYSVPGVWNMDEGGKWSENFELIMKLGTRNSSNWLNSIWSKKYLTYCQRVFEEEGREIYRMIESVEESDEDISEQLQEMTVIANGTANGTANGIENPAKDKVKDLIEVIYEKKTDMSDGVYLELCNRLKEIHNIL